MRKSKQLVELEIEQAILSSPLTIEMNNRSIQV
jgi:hypothetical protein